MSFYYESKLKLIGAGLSDFSYFKSKFNIKNKVFFFFFFFLEGGRGRVDGG